MASFFRRKRAAGPEPTPEDQAPAADAARARTPDDDVSPLADRLRTMDWPTPSDEVRERCLREIMSRVGDEDASHADDAQREPGTGANRAAG